MKSGFIFFIYFLAFKHRAVSVFKKIPLRKIPLKLSKEYSFQLLSLSVECFFSNKTVSSHCFPSSLKKFTRYGEGTFVLNKTFILFYLHIISIWSIGIKTFIRPNNSNHIFFAFINKTMSISNRYIYYF